jgi:MoaA/NifB/PqqE/SkfB family radical SAM enzyme
MIPEKYTGESKLRFGSVISTYRCNAKCNMCYIWKYPTKPKDEIGVDVYEKLPQIDAINLTGGEPFLRTDLDDVVTVLKTKCRRMVISSNGWHVGRTIRLFEKHGNSIGIRISIEGLSRSNDQVRGMPGGFDHALEILTTLNRMGIKDIGFGLTVQDANAKNVMALYSLAKMMGVEFATAALHNSFYFHKDNNRVDEVPEVLNTLKMLSEDLLKSRSPKNWFRSYFNYGLMNYLQGNERLLPCRMAHDAFFIEPNGDILPCNGMDEPMPFGNLREQSWQEIWHSAKAEQVREHVRNCPKQCWMMGSVSQEMKKHVATPLKWVIKHKWLGQPITIPEKAADHPHGLFGNDGLKATETMQLINIGRAQTDRV